MHLSRRGFLAALGGASLAYAFRFESAGEAVGEAEGAVVQDLEGVCAAVDRGIDYRDWMLLGPGKKVTVFTGRTEIGQGLRTVLYSVLAQGLELPRRHIEVIMGDTELCPDDGPTAGSSSTKVVGWNYWLACRSVRDDLVRRGAAALGCDETEVVYRRGEIRSNSGAERKVSIFELGRGESVVLTVNTGASSGGKRKYRDPGFTNVLGNQIITGRIRYCGDLSMEGMLYGAYLTQPYHLSLTRLVSADLEVARRLPGVVGAEIDNGRVAVIAESFTALQNGLAAVEAQWMEPGRPRILANEEEIRAGAELKEIRERKGDVESGLADSGFVLSETYTTQYASQCPIETDTAIASVSGVGATVWVSSQHPFQAQADVAAALNIPHDSVRVIGAHVGGGFGGKIVTPVAAEAAWLSRLAGRPVMYVYSRADQFLRRSRFKESCVIDLTTGVDSDGKMLARKIDIFQDEGGGTTKTYDIPNVLTRLYQTEMPVRHATSRGTSYVQDCFATESHVDQVAHAIGVDPWEFRRNNVALQKFRDLLDACAEMFGYRSYQPPRDRGIGVAIARHGTSQYGAFMVEVSVNRRSGAVAVERVCGAIDIGPVICRNTLMVGVRGAIMWGIGYALMEEIELDGHRTYTHSLGQYRIPRFSDVPRIDIQFINTEDGRPRGCGELPMIPTIPAIANAVYNATGVRFFSTPITPERLRAELRR